MLRDAQLKNKHVRINSLNRLPCWNNNVSCEPGSVHGRTQEKWSVGSVTDEPDDHAHLRNKSTAERRKKKLCLEHKYIYALLKLAWDC